MDIMNNHVTILNEHGDYINSFRIEDGTPALIATDQNNFIYFGIQFQDDETRRLSIHLYDIFTPDGIFIGKMSLGNYRREYSPLPVKIKNTRLYSLREKESGYKMERF